MRRRPSWRCVRSSRARAGRGRLGARRSRRRDDMCLVKLLVGPGRDRREGQGARARTPKASASRCGCRRTRSGTSASATTVAAAGSAAATATQGRSAARCRRSSTPTSATRRPRPMPASRGTRTARSPSCPTASVNTEALRDFATRAMVEQAVKTEALVRAVLRQGAEVPLLRRPLAGRPPGHEDRAAAPRAIRRLHDRQPAISPPSSAPRRSTAARDEARAGLHRARQGARRCLRARRSKR